MRENKTTTAHGRGTDIGYNDGEEKNKYTYPLLNRTDKGEPVRFPGTKIRGEEQRYKTDPGREQHTRYFFQIPGNKGRRKVTGRGVGQIVSSLQHSASQCYHEKLG